VLHVKWSTDPSGGFVEIWRGGVQQTLANGLTRMYLATFVPAVNGTGNNNLRMNLDRSAAFPLGTTVLYHDDIRVGRTYASVTR
jgi:hypothetical protein